MSTWPPARAHVVIIGGGFAGLQAARALRDAPVDVTVVDRTNHHVFQPLLYQVATAVLSPNSIAVPIRFALRRQRNTTVLLAEVTSIRAEQRVVELNGGRRLPYHYLIVAAGARHSYFGHGEWEVRAPGLKSLDDALEVRRRFLLTFERAELLGAGEHPMEQTIVIVGGGPTGVELAGAITEVARRTLAGEFRRTDTRRTRVVLLDRGPRLLSSFDPRLSARAVADLEALGVEVRPNAVVTRITEHAVHVGDEVIPTSTVLWAAGNAASPLGRQLGTPVDRAGRVQVAADLSVPGHPEVFVAGDLAAVMNDGTPVPAVANAAMQMGRRAAENVLATLTGRERVPFRYVNKGSVAVIGRHKAVAQVGRLRFSGPFAWVFWGFLHLHFLIGLRNRVRVFVDWIHALATHRRGDRIIIGLRDAPAPDTLFQPPHRRIETTMPRAPLGIPGLEDGPSSAGGMASGA